MEHQQPHNTLFELTRPAAFHSSNQETRHAFQPAHSIHIALFTGGVDKPYAVGLATSLADNNVLLDVIGSDELECPELTDSANVAFLNYRGHQGPDTFRAKTKRLLRYYYRIFRYIATSDATIFHILWHTRKLLYFDRTLLLLYIKLCGKQIAFTAHNVNAARRDGTDSLLNRLTLQFQYAFMDQIFVHTDRMKAELISDFHVRESKITIIPYPVNQVIPDSTLTPSQARERLGIAATDKVLLFFGRLCPYKGVETLITAFQTLCQRDPAYKLLIAGSPSEEDLAYVDTIRQSLDQMNERVIAALRFIPDEQVELYFKSADVLVLPYKDIFQSGILFLAYTFGLPVIASDVGSFRTSVIEGETGYIFTPGDPADLTRILDTYFHSSIFHHLDHTRKAIQNYVQLHHSSSRAAHLTRTAYLKLLEAHSSALTSN